MSDTQPIIHSALTSTTSLAAAAAAAAAPAPAAVAIDDPAALAPTPPSYTDGDAASSFTMVEAGNLALMVMFGLLVFFVSMTGVLVYSVCGREPAGASTPARTRSWSSLMSVLILAMIRLEQQQQQQQQQAARAMLNMATIEEELIV